MQYELITDLAHWQPHSVMVHISEEQTALIRLYHPQTIPNEWFSIEDALQRAHTLVATHPENRDVVVFLAEGAQWDQQFGELVSR